MSIDIKAYDLQSVMEQEIEVVSNAKILSFYYRLDKLKMDCLVDNEQAMNAMDKYSILTIAAGGVPFKIEYSKYEYGGLVYEGLHAFHMFYRKI